MYGRSLPGSNEDRAEIQHARQQHDPVQIHALLVLQIAGEVGGAGGAVAFAGQELGRCPAAMARSVEPDELAHRLHVAIHAVELPRVVPRRGTAVAGGDRVDEDQVRDVQDRVFVVHQLIRRRRRIAGGCSRTRLGPSVPRCSQTDDDPGPPLKAYVMGRRADRSRRRACRRCRTCWRSGCRLPS